MFDPKRNRRIIGKDKRRAKKHCKHGPELVLKLLRMMKARLFVCDKHVQAVQENDQAGAHNGSHHKKREQHQYSALVNSKMCNEGEHGIKAHKTRHDFQEVLLNQNRTYHNKQQQNDHCGKAIHLEAGKTCDRRRPRRDVRTRWNKNMGIMFFFFVIHWEVSRELIAYSSVTDSQVSCPVFSSFKS